MELSVKKFSELTASELYEILRAREAVFIVEQNRICHEIDGADELAYHVTCRENGKLVGYLRVLDKGLKLDEVSIGRVLTLERGKGFGIALVREGIKVACTVLGAKKVKVEAQCHAVPFYEKAGFYPVGEEFMEEGTPHRLMIYEH